MNYNGRIFRGQSNSPNGEVGNEILFYYHQDGDKLSGKYSGGSIVDGHLIGNVNPDSSLDFCYHHVNIDDQLMAGKCHSTPEEDKSGRLILKEQW